MNRFMAPKLDVLKHWKGT